MSDCVLWAFKNHMRHMGFEPAPFTDDLFRALRKPSLPGGREVWFRGITDRFGNFTKVDEHDHRYREARSYDFSFTNGAVAPLIIRTLASYNGLRVRGQYDMMYSPEVLMKMATTDVQARVAYTTPDYFGKEVMQIDLEPAIYLMVSGEISKHAHFDANIPVGRGVIAGAYQLYVPNSLND